MRSLYEVEVRPDEIDAHAMSREELVAEFQEDARDAYRAKEEQYGAELIREIERYLVLQVVDVRWREHLDAMEYLREGIHLRAMAQKDPLVEYRGEGHGMFEELGRTIREEVLRYLFHVEIEVNEAENLQPAAGPDGDLVYEHELLAGADAISAAGGAPGEAALAAVSTAPSLGATSVVTQRTASEWDQRGPKRPVPLRLGQEVQALPRRLAPLARTEHFRFEDHTSATASVAAAALPQEGSSSPRGRERRRR